MEFPIDMKNERRWVAWFYQDDPQHPNDVHKRKKVPHNLNSPLCAERASSANPKTWGTYQQVKAVQNFANSHPERVKATQYGGPGFIIDGGWGFLDLDNITPVIANHNLGEHNEIDDILDLLGHTYCEISQSQSGLHFIFKIDDTVQAFNKKHIGRELYTSSRLVALTGKALEADEPLNITTINQATWKQLNTMVFGSYTLPFENNSSFSDTKLSHGVLSRQGAAIMNAILHSSDADRFNWWCTADLPTVSTDQSGQQIPDWNGELINYDPSSQDMACCNMLAYWVRYYVGEYDSKLIDEIFKQTHLYRPKWNRADGSGTYGQRTIQQAIAHKQSQLTQYINSHKQGGNV